MTTALALLLLVIALGLLTLLQLGAQIEMYRQIEQLREHIGFIDRSMPIDLGEARGKRPSAVGLPADLDESASSVVLFLSDKCVTCRSIVAALEGTIPAGLTMVLDPGTAPRGSQLLDDVGLADGDVIVDWGRHIMGLVGLKATPTAVLIREGHLERASTVPSARRLFQLLRESDTFANAKKPLSQQSAVRTPSR